MALPQDGQDANGLTKVTQIPARERIDVHRSHHE